MFVPNILENVYGALTLSAKQGPAQSATIIEEEPQWRTCPPLQTKAVGQRVKATRWRRLDHQTRDVSAQIPADRHLVGIALRTETISYTIAGRIVHDGIAEAGTIHVSEPGTAARCIFRGPFDVLHLHVPNSLIAECASDANAHEPPALHSAPALGNDMTIEQLGRALLAAEELEHPFGMLYADCVSTSIVSRLLASSLSHRRLTRSKVAALARWRLKRATEYIDANLGNTITLPDLAAAAGLTRMHFAAQFRAAVGVSPHQYVMRRRIERAQEMLVAVNAPLVEVAISVGFQAQSHFTMVFRRLTGETPHAWRQAHSRLAPISERSGTGDRSTDI
jgi:AraC family transcriptional regulator